jgi:hypothetical protein
MEDGKRPHEAANAFDPNSKFANSKSRGGDPALFTQKERHFPKMTTLENR